MCEVCDHTKANGRQSLSDPIVCRRCHSSWTGTEAQHCVTCHLTFTSITSADKHLTKQGRHLVPDPTAGWVESRPGVWAWSPYRPGSPSPATHTASVG